MLRVHHGLPPQPGFQLRFGQRFPFEKDISVDFHSTPVTEPAAANTPLQPLKLFFFPLATLIARLPDLVKPWIEPFLTQLLDGKLAPKEVALKGPFGNVFSVIQGTKPDPDADPPKEPPSMSPALVKAFKRALADVRKAENLVIAVPPESDLAQIYPDKVVSSNRIARDLAREATLLGYNERIWRQDYTPPSALKAVQLANLSESPQAAITEGVQIGRGMNLTRYLVDGPPNIKNPAWMSAQAKAVADEFPDRVTVEIHEKGFIEAQKMGLFLSVAQGNQQTLEDQPRLVEMVYTPPNGKFDKTVLLVGKGVIFDTGGTNLKTGVSDGLPTIHGMHGDMAGAAAVIGAMRTIAALQLPNVRVVAINPITPNRIGENATLPHSFPIARNGKTVEVWNTDAEGRLILADAIHYGGEKYKPDLTVDIATLTGGKVRALGDQNAVAVMGNQPKLAQTIEKLEKDLGRKAQAIKLTETHRDWMIRNGTGKSDITNSRPMTSGKDFGIFGEGIDYDSNNKEHSLHHAAQGGAFLREFLFDPKTPWIHLDMAGAEFEVRDHDHFATGFGVEDLYEIVKQVSKGTLLPTYPAGASGKSGL